MSATFDVVMHLGQMDMTSGRAVVTLTQPSGTGMIGELVDGRIELGGLAPNQAFAAAPLDAGRRILLEVEDPSLFVLPWENLLPSLFSQASAAGSIEVIRSLPTLPSQTGIPFDLPMDVLMAGAQSRWSSPAVRSALKYFRPQVAPSADRAALHTLFGKRNFEIAHLRYPVVWHGGQGALQTGPADQVVGVSELTDLLGMKGPRLLVIEDPTGSAEPILDFGHRMLEARGIPTVVTSAVGSGQPDSLLSDLYMNIVHDKPLNHALTETSRLALGGTVAFFTPQGGEDTLRISPLAKVISDRRDVALDRARQALQDLSAHRELAPTTKRIFLPGETQLKRVVGSLVSANLENLNFAQEIEGMVSLRKTSELIDQTNKVVASVRRSTERVVNCYFTQDERTLSSAESLAAGQEYAFEFQIGAHSSRSHVREPKEIPETELEKVYEDGGIRLRIVVSSNDFVIEKPDCSLLLPRPPAETQTLRFSVRAPGTPCTAHLKACIYYQRNLLQALSVVAAVTSQAEPRHEFGNFAEVEYALSGTLRDVDRYPARALSILTDETSLSIAGTDLHWQLDLKKVGLPSSFGAARDKLQEICGVPPNPYRFKQDNKGNRDDFAQGLRELAGLGFSLYASLVISQDPAFEQGLRESLRNGSTIQIAMSKSAKSVFPWALVYDRMLVRGPNTRICPELLAALDRGGEAGFLAEIPCFSSNCPYENDTNVICPSGFWGLRNIIEQPLSASPLGDGASRDVITEIGGRSPVELLMAVSRKLTGLEEHEGELKDLKALAVDIENTKQGIGQSLQRQDLKLVYFYCHGGREKDETWLGVGDGEKLFPSDLLAWRVRWPSHPLVFVNGCHTVDLTPDDLLPFSRMLARGDASGVIGTEISIPESLARSFANGFLKGLLRGLGVGEIVRRQRLLLLERRNLLGLVYTPYCHADLHIAAARGAIAA